MKGKGENDTELDTSIMGKCKHTHTHFDGHWKWLELFEPQLIYVTVGTLQYASSNYIE